MNIYKSQREKITKWLGVGSINIFGWPFSGKDTQGKRLAELFGAPLIGGGDILRNAEGVPEHVRKTIDLGKLAPTQDFLNIVTPYLSKPEFKNKPLILSSVGRWDGEQQVIVKAADDSGHPIKAVICLTLSENEARTRWQAAQVKDDRGHRADDAEEILATRFDEFKNKTLPVIDFYKQKNMLIEIDGSLTPDEVTSQIIQKLTDKVSG